MNFEQFKTEFNSNGVIAIIDEERGVIAVLSDLDKFTRAIEEDREMELISINSCETFDYGYKGDIQVTMKDENDGEEYDIAYELISTTLY